jgi:hypothetical protein
MVRFECAVCVVGWSGVGEVLGCVCTVCRQGCAGAYCVCVCRGSTCVCGVGCSTSRCVRGWSGCEKAVSVAAVLNHAGEASVLTGVRQ